MLRLDNVTSELSVYLILDSDRVRYEFPIKKDIVAAILAKQNAAEGGPGSAAETASSMGVVAVRAPHQKLEQIAEYVRGLSESDRRLYFTKEGRGEYACLLELGGFES